MHNKEILQWDFEMKKETIKMQKRVSITATFHNMNSNKLLSVEYIYIDSSNVSIYERKRYDRWLYVLNDKF